MNWSSARILGLLLTGTTLVACVDSGCPEGSHEVDGQCMELADEHDASTDTKGVEAGGRGDAGSTGSGRADSGTGQSDRPDSGATAGSGGASTSDAGSAADASTDAAAPTEQPVTCGAIQCDPNATCNDATSPPSCACSPGWEGDGLTCTNIDECTAATHDCDSNADCTDEPGTFSCACKPGYEGDGHACTANPCEERVNPCDAATATCRADGTTAVCDCVEGRGRCDGDETACNTDLTSDADNCGACDYACAGDLGCQNSACDQPIKTLALGYNHSCAIDRDDKVLCWGANDAGQLNRTGTARPTYEPSPAALGPARLLSAGGDFSCAVLKNDDLTCWGSNVGGQIVPIGDPTPPSQGVFTLGTGEDSATAIASGSTTSCVLLAGFPYCWGRAFGRELGSTTTAFNYSEANKVDLPAPALGISVGFAQACAVSNDHKVRCWGPSNATAAEIVDADSNGLTGVTGVTSGSTGGSGCVVLSNGHVQCWGVNNYGQLGNPSITATSSIYAVTVLDGSGTPLTGAVQVQAGAQHACARRDDGSVVCWGRRDLLGTGSSGTSPQRSFVEVAAVRDAIDIAVKNLHTCVRRRNGQVQCWGDNSHGEAGVDPATTALATEPVNVIGLP